MKKTVFYVCPICGNIIHSVGEGAYSCCGIHLPALECEEDRVGHEANVEIMDNEYYVSMNHEMTKQHYISFAAYVTSDMVQIVKLYPEQEMQTRFLRKGHGMMYTYCNRHGLMKWNV